MFYSMLRVVPIESCLLHERTDSQRVARIVERLTSEQILHNPPIIGAHPRLEQFMVLDGATRTTALRQLGVRHLIAQVVAYDDPTIALEGWNHAVSNTSQTALLETVQSATEIIARPCSEEVARKGVTTGNALAYSIDAAGACLVFEAPTSQYQRHALLQRLFEQYTQLGSIARTVEQTVPAEMNTILIVFPHYQKEALINLVRQRQVVPAGITRHTVPERVLRMNIPVAFLHSDESLDHKQAWLDAWLQERRATQRVRYYQEPTVVFDD